jgi:16S rRNA (cytosine967-C5)-methyltransferase
MYRPFRLFHLLAIFNAYDQQTLPLDLFLKDYFSAHKAIGSKDRTYIAGTAYSLIRWKGLLDFLCNENFISMNWENRLDLFLDPKFESAKTRSDIPTHVHLSFPKELFNLIVESHGLQKAQKICEICNHSAPTTVRVNIIKTTREQLLKKWSSIYEVSPCSISELGIVFHRRINFLSMQEFKDGLFEVQDEGSQLLADLIKAKPGDLVMDYCAGSGGKTLAFAPRMLNKGQIYLHDIRNYVLEQAKKRLRRAGIHNTQIVLEGDAKLKKLKKNMDWVLVDAPCSGTGTLRRNPEMKWKFDSNKFERIQGQQRTIFEKALSFLKPDGRIIYSTCSILKEENQEQAAHFIKTYHLNMEGEVFESLPQKNGMDGFYGIVLKRK